MDFYSDVMDEVVLGRFIKEHAAERERLNKLDDYYKGRHDILRRRRSSPDSPNNRLVCNYAKYITDTAIGYAFGNPVRVKIDGEDDADASALFAANATHDAELAKDLSVFGVGYELICADGGVVRPALIDPRRAFVVKGESFLGGSEFGVIYGEEGKKTVARVYSADRVVSYEGDERGKFVKVGESEHLFGAPPLVRYLNNEEGMGDFEHVMTLIDAYNTLQSDRVNDKERFVDSILMLRGCQFPDDESAAKMMANRVLELPFDNADAKYLTKAMNEAETEILRKAIASDIHKFSQTPDFSDEHFSGNTSGVAIKYKLLSIENLAKIKERFFVAGARERLRLAERALAALGRIAPPDDGETWADRAEFVFDRTLPVNELERAQIAEKLKGIVAEDELREGIKW